jgi:hypothetical protein
MRALGTYVLHSHIIGYMDSRVAHCLAIYLHTRWDPIVARTSIPRGSAAETRWLLIVHFFNHPLQKDCHSSSTYN